MPGGYIRPRCCATCAIRTTRRTGWRTGWSIWSATPWRSATGAALLVAHAPRAMIDLNRAPDDIDWDMVAGGGSADSLRGSAAGKRARSGLGLVPRRLPGLGELWRPKLTREDLAATDRSGSTSPIMPRWRRHWNRLRDRWGTALLIDLHSMPPLGAEDGR